MVETPAQDDPLEPVRNALLEHRDVHKQLGRKLRQLQGPDRDAAFLLCRQAGWKPTQLGELTGLSRSRVNQILSRAGKQ